MYLFRFDRQWLMIMFFQNVTNRPKHCRFLYSGDLCLGFALRSDPLPETLIPVNIKVQKYRFQLDYILKQLILSCFYVFSFKEIILYSFNLECIVIFRCFKVLFKTTTKFIQPWSHQRQWSFDSSFNQMDLCFTVVYSIE